MKGSSTANVARRDSSARAERRGGDLIEEDIAEVNLSQNHQNDSSPRAVLIKTHVSSGNEGIRNNISIADIVIVGAAQSPGRVILISNSINDARDRRSGASAKVGSVDTVTCTVGADVGRRNGSKLLGLGVTRKMKE